MNFPFDPESERYFPTDPGLPAGFNGLLLQGAKVESFAGGTGEIILQSYTRPEFSIQFGIIKFLSVIRMILGERRLAAGSLLALKGNFLLNDRKDQQPLRENQFTFLKPGPTEVTLHFQASGEQQFFEVSWSQEILQEALAFFPTLSGLFADKRPTRSSSPLLMTGRRAGYQALDLVNMLLKSPFTAEQTELFFQYKIREYLLLLLKEASLYGTSSLLLTDRELAALSELKTRLTTQPRSKYPIHKLAAETGMNTMRLKMAFKQQYGETIFSFHLSERMNEARRLIAETDLPTKAVAGLVGYKLTTSFITKFREFFGYPPGEVKKKF